MNTKDIEEWLRIFEDVQAGFPASSESYTERAAKMAEHAKELFIELLEDAPYEPSTFDTFAHDYDIE